MIFVMIRNFFRGYLLVKIRGEFIERFFNMCAYRNIYIWDITKKKDDTYFKMSMRGFRECRDICRKTHSRLTILRKYGFPIWLRGLKRRKFFIIGLCLFIAFFVISSQFIWAIEIHGLKHEKASRILEDLESVGLKEGVYKRQFDPEIVKEKILLKDNRLAWIWVDIKGNKAIVNVKEKVEAPELVAADKPCNIVALKMGIVSRKSVKVGDCKLQEGDTVFPGDILISGIMVSQTPDVPVRYVHAEGEIYAHTWHEKIGEFNLYKEKKIYTGEEKKSCYMKLLGKKISLSLPVKNPYQCFDISQTNHNLKIGENHYLGISFLVEKIREYKIVKIPLTEEQAALKAKKKLEKEMDNSLTLHYKKINENFTYEKTSDAIITATISGEYEEQIGVSQPVTPGELPPNAEEKK